MKRTRVISRWQMAGALSAIVVALLMIPLAQGQQDVDPTWFDPWATPQKTVVQASVSSAATHKLLQKNIPVSRRQSAKKPRVKQTEAPAKELNRLPD